MRCRSKSFACLGMRSVDYIKFLLSRVAQCRVYRGSFENRALPPPPKIAFFMILQENTALVRAENVIPGRKYNSVFRGKDFNLPEAVLNSFNTCPSSFQSTTNVRFPYHFLKSPPLQYGNHRVPFLFVSSVDLQSKLRCFIETSNHALMNLSLSHVSSPLAERAALARGGLLAKSNLT